MGLFDRLRGEFIDVIEWVEDDRNTLAYRFPTHNREIQMGSSLIVRESQHAIFVYQGEIADVFEPGHYKLSTANMPLMTTLQHWTHGFNSPFKSEVYFINMRQFPDLKWGTPSPITLRDADFGVLRIRAFGNFIVRVCDPEKLMQELLGTAERLRVDEVQNQIRGAIVTRFTDFIGESQIPFLDHAANLNEFSKALGPAMHDELARFGLGVEEFFIQNISLPPEVEKAIDQRSSMAAVGDMDAYTKFQVASSLPNAMAGGGDSGLASAGIGAGLGAALGSAIGGSLNPAANQGQQAPAQAAPAEPKVMVRCPECSTLCEETARFCANCGYQLIKT